MVFLHLLFILVGRGQVDERIGAQMGVFLMWPAVRMAELSYGTLSKSEHVRPPTMTKNK